jgi:hypothetical protein
MLPPVIVNRPGEFYRESSCVQHHRVGECVVVRGLVQTKERAMASRMCKIAWVQTFKATIGLLALLTVLGGAVSNVQANAIVVAHDINTLGSAIAGSQEAAFAVNVANLLTAGDSTKDLLLFESNPGDGTRNFDADVVNALTSAGFAVTVTSNYATAFAGFDAIFVAQDFPAVGFLNNTALISYVEGGGGVYLAGGVGPSAAGEAAGWSTFLSNYGLAFASTYNGINNVTVTSAHPIFAGITALKSGNGQSIIDLGTNPNAQIVQMQSGHGVYAVVTIPTVAPIPEPATIILMSFALLGLAAAKQYRRFLA